MILRQDHIAGGIFVVAGIAVFAVSGDLPLGSMAMPGAGMMPKLVLGLMVAFGLVLMLRAGESPPFATIAWNDLPHAASVTIATAAAIALYTTLGFRITTGLMLFGLLVAVERQNLVRAIVFSIAVPIGTDILFGILLKSPLPRGLLRILGLVESTLDSLMLGFSVAFRPDVLWYAFLGCLVGTLVGILPGIGPLAGISILLPATFGLDATKAIVMLAGIYYGSQYGGSTTSILMRIPGEAASVMTCIDGYAMAQKGRAGAALCIAAVGSFIAGTFGVVVLTRDRAAARHAGAAVRAARIHHAADARAHLPRLHVVDVAHPHAVDGERSG